MNTRTLNIGMTTALDGDSGKMVRYKLASGMNSSALEHSVPEQLFSTPDASAQGVSAVKALQIANNQGIPIYTISKDNIASVLPNLQLDTDVIQDIQNAVNTGKEVTVSKSNISFGSWTGVGYIITDPLTGDGAYMISGGLAGAEVLVGFLTALVLPMISTGVYSYYGYAESDYLYASFMDMYSITICTLSIFPFTQSCKDKCDARYGADKAAEYRWCVAKFLMSVAVFKAIERYAIEPGLHKYIVAEQAKLIGTVLGLVILNYEILTKFLPCTVELGLL